MLAGFAEVSPSFGIGWIDRDRVLKSGLCQMPLAEGSQFPPRSGQQVGGVGIRIEIDGALQRAQRGAQGRIEFDGVREIFRRGVGIGGGEQQGDFTVEICN